MIAEDAFVGTWSGTWEGEGNPNDEAEIVLTPTFTESEAKGTWSARVKTSGEKVASSTWNAAMK